MNDIRNPLPNPIITGRPEQGTTVRRQTPVTTSRTDTTFGDLLQQKIEQQSPLTFSKHAKNRTEQRGISLNESDLMRLTEAVGKANDKGLRDTLVFMNNTAFIVNVPSKVVVTVVDGSETEQNVFTNIDGAVIV
jgi:flagellar operon protein